MVVPFACGSFGGAEAGKLFRPENNMPFGMIEKSFPSATNKKQLSGEWSAVLSPFRHLAAVEFASLI
jgi:hypothetical protein